MKCTAHRNVKAPGLCAICLMKAAQRYHMKREQDFRASGIIEEARDVWMASYDLAIDKLIEKELKA